MAAYAVDRVTRLWIVLIPAFVVSLAIGAYTGAIDPGTVSYAVANEYSVVSFLGNLIGLQDVALTRFGGNFPLWSLANETWYYVLFPLLVMPFVGKTVFSRAASVAVCLFVAASLPGPIVLYFSLWLLGVAFSRIGIVASAVQRWAVVCLLVGIAVYLRLSAISHINNASFIHYLAFSMPFLLLLSSLQFRADSKRRAIMLAKRIGTLLAGFSFTWYVIHVPFLMLLRDIYPPLRNAHLSPRDVGDLGTYCTMLVGILVLSYLFHLPFEAQTHRMRSFIKTRIIGAGAHTPRTPPARSDKLAPVFADGTRPRRCQRSVR
jgi:peptidoglycan/LPS O-acetylase OafA/YrhL